MGILLKTLKYNRSLEASRRGGGLDIHSGKAKAEYTATALEGWQPLRTSMIEGTMPRTVFCKKYQQELEGLEKPPYPGPSGQAIFEEVSKKAWLEWQSQQTMLINEKHLNMMDADDRRYIQEQMDRFLSGDDYEKAEGYIPEAK